MVRNRSMTMHTKGEKARAFSLSAQIQTVMFRSFQLYTLLLVEKL